MANYTVIIICTEPSDAKSLFHWESASLEPHLPVNKLNLQVFFSKYYLQKIKKIYMISTFCSISHLNLKEQCHRLRTPTAHNKKTFELVGNARKLFRHQEERKDVDERNCSHGKHIFAFFCINGSLFVRFHHNFIFSHIDKSLSM